MRRKGTAGVTGGRGVWWTVAAVALAVAVFAVVLLSTQFEKWTCGPPEGVWVEGPDICVNLP